MSFFPASILFNGANETHQWNYANDATIVDGMTSKSIISKEKFGVLYNFIKLAKAGVYCKGGLTLFKFVDHQS